MLRRYLGREMTSQPAGEPPFPPYAYYYPPPRRTNTMAIVALVMLFVFAPLAIIFGAIAHSQIKQTGEDGEGFAKAGIIGGIVLTVLYVVMTVVMLIVFFRFLHVVEKLPHTTAPNPT